MRKVTIAARLKALNDHAPRDLRRWYYRAKRYAAAYGAEFLEPWSRDRALWHVWHAHALCGWLSYRRYLARIITICREKPENERKLRLRLMRPAAWDIGSLSPLMRRAVVEGVCMTVSDMASGDLKALGRMHKRQCPRCKWRGTACAGRLPQLKD